MAGTAIHTYLLTAVVERIAALNLDGTQARVSRTTIPDSNWYANLRCPCVVVLGAGNESPSVGVLSASGIDLPVLVRIMDTDPLPRVERQDELVWWRQVIREDLRDKPLIKSGVWAWKLTYLDSPVIEEVPEGWQRVSLPLMFKARVLEPR